MLNQVGKDFKGGGKSAYSSTRVKAKGNKPPSSNQLDKAISRNLLI